MSLTTRVFAGFVLVVSAAVLGTALLSQYWGGLTPCELCLIQRWPWPAAVVLSLTVLFGVSRAGGNLLAWLIVTGCWVAALLHGARRRGVAFSASRGAA